MTARDVAIAGLWAVIDRPYSGTLLLDGSERAEVGSRLGPYAIVSAAGAGGMGQVYKARDTRLHLRSYG